MSFLRKIALCAKPQSGRGHTNASRSARGRDARGADGADIEAGDPDADRVECAVCQDAPTDPCTVPCGNKHVFCLECLRGLVLHNHYTSSFPCPLCRTRVKIPLRGLTVLKDNKGWGERLLARLALVRPRCPRRSGRHSWTSSNSVGSGASWPPPDQLLEIVLPYLEEGAGQGAGQRAGQRDEPLPLDSAWLNRLRLGRLYVDTLTLTRRRPGLDSLSGSADGGEGDADHDDNDDDDTNEDMSSGYEDFSTTVCLDTIDVQLQREILEAIERQVARTRRLDIDLSEEGTDGDTAADQRLSPSHPLPSASSPGFGDDDDDWDNVSARDVSVEMDHGARANSAFGERTEEAEVGGVWTKSDAREKDAPLPEAERHGAKGGVQSHSGFDLEGDTDSLDMNCVMQLIADLECAGGPAENPRDVTAVDQRSVSEERPASPSGALREANDAGRTSRALLGDTERASGLVEGTGRDTSKLTDGTGRGSSFRQIGASAGKTTWHSSDRRSRSDVQAGSWLDESWKHDNPTRYFIPRPKLVGSQASLQTSHEADTGRSGLVTTV